MESKYDYVVFDIETTGLHPDSDQICEIAAIGVKDGLPQGTFSTLVAGVHGWRDAGIAQPWHVRRTRRVEDMEVTTFQLYWHYSLLY